MNINEALPVALLFLAIGVVAGWRAAIKVGFERGYSWGHTRGVLDATPWRCGCGRDNAPNHMMCGKCGADRSFEPIGPSGVLSLPGEKT